MPQVIIKRPCHVDGIKRAVGAAVDVTDRQAAGLVESGWAVLPGAEVETAASIGGAEVAADVRPRSRRG